MLEENVNNELFHVYYKRWITVYKEGAIRSVTMAKYLMTHQWLIKLAPSLKLCEVTRISYQQLLNDYAADHERQTTMDFHHQLKGAVLEYPLPLVKLARSPSSRCSQAKALKRVKI